MILGELYLQAACRLALSRRSAASPIDLLRISSVRASDLFSTGARKRAKASTICDLLKKLRVSTQALVAVSMFLSFDVVANPCNVSAETEVRLVSSCIQGDGRVDLNIHNMQTAISEYRLELQGLTARETSVSFEDWGRMSVTGRPEGEYAVTVKRDGQVIHSENVLIDCDTQIPTVSDPEINLTSACRAGDGYVLLHFVNSSDASRPYVIEFDGVPNRSTTAAPFGQAVRAVTGRPDGYHDFTIRAGSSDVYTGEIFVDCG